MRTLKLSCSVIAGLLLNCGKVRGPAVVGEAGAPEAAAERAGSSSAKGKPFVVSST